jgi:hypothetical protein
MPMITLIMSDDGEILASETFETDYLAEAVSKYDEFLNKGGFVLPGKLGFEVKPASEQKKDAYQEILEYYKNTNQYGDINIDF